MLSCHLQSYYSSMVRLHGGPVVLHPVRATPCFYVVFVILCACYEIYDRKCIIRESWFVSVPFGPDHFVAQTPNYRSEGAPRIGSLMQANTFSW